MIIQARHLQRGLSLVELMVAVTLSMVLMLGVIQIFSSSKQTSRVQDALSRVQENARFTLDLLTHDIRMAGQLGCNNSVIPTDKTGGTLRDFGAGIDGYEYSDSLSVVLINGHALNPDSSDVVSGTDSIVIMAASSNSIPATSNSNTVEVANASLINTIAQGDPLIISDCENADIFTAGTRNGKRIDIGASSFSKQYADGAELAPLNYVAYYIRLNNGHKNLYRSIVNAKTGNASIDPDPLIEGVEDMQILYGERVGNNIRYVDADQVANMANVTSVRVYLLFSTIENNLALGEQKYWFKGQLYNPDNSEYIANDDNKLYRAFTATIQLRNKGLGA